MDIWNLEWSLFSHRDKARSLSAANLTNFKALPSRSNTLI
jgi:hypothetical protein